MNTASTRTVIAATLLGGSMSVWALGVGPARVTAVLGQSLDAVVPLYGDAGEPVPMECIEAKVFFGEDRLAGDQVRLRLEAASTTGERLLRVSTTAAVNEPVVSLRVTAGCGTAVAREFVAFADPPSTRQAAAPIFSAAAPQALPAPVPARPAAAAPVEPLAKPSVKPPRQADAAPPPRRAAPAEPAARSRAAKPAAASAAAPAPRSSSDLRAEPGPRLQLDPLMPASQAASGAGDVALAGASGAPSPQAAAEAARLRALEATLAEVRSEMALTRRTLEGLEARARAAEQDRAWNSVIHALAALGVALSAALGWLLLERRRERKAAAWGEGLVAAQELALAPGPHRQEPSAAEGPGASAARAVAPLPEPAADMPQAAGTAAALPPPEAEPAAKRHAALEELLDLDQQAAFLVALGQEQAAIGLLQAHLDRNASTSPLPWLELLALHQRRGDRPAFEAVGKRFAERFGAAQPAWGTELQQGCALEDYPAVIERLEWQWHDPDEVAALLEVLLLRSGGMDNMPDLPACQDLLLLYALVRERLVGNEAVAASLDAELPWSFCQVERPRRGARRPAPPAVPAPELPPMPWTGADVRLPADFGAQLAPSPEPAHLALDEPLPVLDFEPLQFEPAELSATGARP